MTVKELRQVTKCPIFIEWTDSNGAVFRKEWTGGAEDYRIGCLKIIHEKLIGFALCAVMEEE